MAKTLAGTALRQSTVVGNTSPSIGAAESALLPPDYVPNLFGPRIVTATVLTPHPVVLGLIYNPHFAEQ